MTDDKKIKTGQSICGNWAFDGEVDSKKNQMLISITKERLIINWLTVNIYTKSEELSANAHWFGDYLLFTEKQKYFVKHADENTMIFGELTQPGVIGLPLWSYKFIRMKEPI